METSRITVPCGVCPSNVGIGDEFCTGCGRRVTELEGILPALEPSHALAWLMANPGPGIHLVTLSGRGDKDLAEVLAREE